MGAVHTPRMPLCQPSTRLRQGWNSNAPCLDSPLIQVRHVKEAFLDKQRARGDMTDPFQQSRRQQQHHFSN